MTKNLVEGIVGLLNDFPSNNGESQKMSPSMIVTGAQMPDYNIKRIVFGSYAQVHLGTTNTMKHRSVPAVALRSSNESGGHYFMSLLSGKRIHSHNWTELPIDDDVIARVEELASKENQPELPNKSPIFEWAPGIEVEPIDEEDESQLYEDTEDFSSILHVQQNALSENDNTIIDVTNTEDENNDEEGSFNEEDINMTRTSGEDHNTESDAELENVEVDELNDSIQNDNDNDHNNIEDVSQDTDESKSLLSHDDSDEESFQDANESKSTFLDDNSDEENKSTDECQPKILSSLNDLVAEYQQYQDATAEDDDDLRSKDSDEETEGRPKRKAAGAGVNRLEMRFGGKKYPGVSMKQFLQVTKTSSQNSLEGFLRRCVDVVFT